MYMYLCTLLKSIRVCPKVMIISTLTVTDGSENLVGLLENISPVAIRSIAM